MMAGDVGAAFELLVEPRPQLAGIGRGFLDRRHIALLGRRAHQAPEDRPHRLGDGRKLPVHPAVGFAPLARIVGPQRAGGILGRQVAHATVALPDDAPAVVYSRDDAVGVHVEVPFLVVAAVLQADILALVLEPALVGAPQHLHDIDRIGATPDLHLVSPQSVGTVAKIVIPRCARDDTAWPCQCAEAQLAPMPVSTTSGTESSAAASITVRATVAVLSTSLSGTSNKSSSCTCSSMRLSRCASLSACGSRIMARLMMSAAPPCKGALIAARSWKARIAAALSLMCLRWILRPNGVFTKPCLRA